MIRSACQQMTRAAAILAVALLCAQTLVVIHEHDLSDGVVCAVCSSPAEHADSPRLTAAAAERPTTVSPPSRSVPASAGGVPSTQRARAPPIA